MENIITKLHNLMVKSLNPLSEISSSRYQSYIVLAPILFMIFITTGIEITSFIIAMVHAKTYVLSNEFIIVYGMLLAHHLSVLFSKNKVTSINEVKTNIEDIKGNETSEEVIEEKQ